MPRNGVDLRVESVGHRRRRRRPLEADALHLRAKEERREPDCAQAVADALEDGGLAPLALDGHAERRDRLEARAPVRARGDVADAHDHVGPVDVDAQLDRPALAGGQRQRHLVLQRRRLAAEPPRVPLRGARAVLGRDELERIGADERRARALGERRHERARVEDPAVADDDGADGLERCGLGSPAPLAAQDAASRRRAA